MPVTAKFIPESIQLVPGAPTTLTLRLHNNEEAPQVVNLQPSGDLAEFVTLDVDTAAIESNQIFDIPVSIEVGPHVAAGERQPAVELTSECGSVTATVAAEVIARSEHSVELSPLRSRGSIVGAAHGQGRQFRQRRGHRRSRPPTRSTRRSRSTWSRRSSSLPEPPLRWRCG